MWQEILPALRIKVFLTVLLGIAYPLAVTALSQLFFPHQANGSRAVSNGQVIGSTLIAQNFTRPEYFQPRPSAAGIDGYDATASAGSNYGPTNRKLFDRVTASVEKFRNENPDYKGPLPADLVTASASGLDPHISPASAEAQIARVAKARGVSRQQIGGLINSMTEPPSLGILGESRLNVLELNLALDSRFPLKR